MLLGNTVECHYPNTSNEHHKSNNSMYKQEYIKLYYIIILRFCFVQFSEHLSYPNISQLQLIQITDILLYTISYVLLYTHINTTRIVT